MPLIKCPDCGKEISDKATHCIHCGCPISQTQQSTTETKPKPKLDNENFDSSKFRRLDGAGSIGGSNSSGEYADKTWRCPSCGKALAKNATFCPNCGRRDPHIAKYLPIIIGVFVIALILIFSSGRR